MACTRGAAAATGGGRLHNCSQLPVNITGGEDPDPTTRCRRAIASFIQRCTDIIDEPFFFIVRGSCKQGLCRHMGLSPRMYGALLMAASLISLKGEQVQVSLKNFKEGLIDHPMYQLRGPPGKPNSGTSEFTRVQVLVQSCKLNSSPSDDRQIRNYAIRIGKYSSGSSIMDPAVQINKSGHPPAFSHRLRSLQRWFSLEFRRAISPFLHHPHLPHVQKWVCMEELSEHPLPALTPAKAPPNTPARKGMMPPGVTPSPPNRQGSEHTSSDDDSDYSPGDSDDDSWGGDSMVSLMRLFLMSERRV